MATVEQMQAWCKQTLFYMQYFRDGGTWLTMSNLENNSLAHTAAEESMLQLWREAEVECANTPSLIEAIFVRRVLRLVARHVGTQ